MKKTIFAFCFLCATTAFGQTAGSLSSAAQPTVIPDHPQHASEHAMAQESSLLGNSAYTYAQGERPLWEFATVKNETPLGDTARALKKERTENKKPVKVWEN
jgi:hypothetical protein